VKQCGGDEMKGEFKKRIEQMWREWHDSGDIGVFEDLEKIVTEAKKEFPNIESEKYEGLMHSTYEFWAKDVEKWRKKWLGKHNGEAP